VKNRIARRKRGFPCAAPSIIGLASRRQGRKGICSEPDGGSSIDLADGAAGRTEVINSIQSVQAVHLLCRFSVPSDIRGSGTKIAIPYICMPLCAD